MFAIDQQAAERKRRCISAYLGEEGEEGAAASARLSGGVTELTTDVLPFMRILLHCAPTYGAPAPLHLTDEQRRVLTETCTVGGHAGHGHTGASMPPAWSGGATAAATGKGPPLMLPAASFGCERPLSRR